MEESAAAVAVTIMAIAEGTGVGAVYSPAEVMVPHAAPEQLVPETVHETVWFDEL